MDWYLLVLRKYAVFHGRSRRTEYWMFQLISSIISIALSVMEKYTVAGEPLDGVVSGLYGLAVLVPSLAVSIRRLHDTERSGWWLLINLIPVLGWIAYLFFMVSDGTPGDNAYGHDPKADERGRAHTGPMRM